ncbi:MAG: molybdate ABC transporter substrate-binding protein [Clostridia bacterium]|nr:molybdate ABC transporter substrate-binding protein [Clostridia bacterium]
MKKVLPLVFIILFTLFFAGCSRGGEETPVSKDNSSGPAPEIVISAAASLKDVLEEVQELYKVKKPEVKLVFNFGSSGTLQRQIEQGSPVDLFISAGIKQMDELEEKNLIIAKSRSNLIANELVLVASKDNSELKDFRNLTLAGVKNIGIGNPETVPAGKYAQEALESMSLWAVLEPKLVRAKDVRQVLSYVETGNADAGLVYRSDALKSEKVKIVAAAPEESHRPILYPIAVIASSKNSAVAEEFLQFLKGDEVLRLLVNQGFKKLKK